MISIQRFNARIKNKSLNDQYDQYSNKDKHRIIDKVKDISNCIKNNSDFKSSVIFDIPTERIFNRYSCGKLTELHWDIENEATKEYLKGNSLANGINSFDDMLKLDTYHSKYGELKIVPDVENFWVFNYANLLVKLTPEDLAHDYRVILPMLYVRKVNSDELKAYNYDINKLKELKHKQDDFVSKFIKSKISLSSMVTKDIVKRFIDQIPDDIDDPFNEKDYLGFSSLHVPSEISDNEYNKDIKLYEQVFYPSYLDNALKRVLTKYTMDRMLGVNTSQAKLLVNDAWRKYGSKYYANEIFNTLNNKIDLIQSFKNLK